MRPAQGLAAGFPQTRFRKPRSFRVPAFDSCHPFRFRGRSDLISAPRSLWFLSRAIALVELAGLGLIVVGESPHKKLPEFVFRKLLVEPLATHPEMFLRPE